MNSATVAEPALLNAMANPEVVKLLEQLLDAARAGQIIGLGVGIAIGPGRFNGFAVGGCLAEINLGLDAAKAVILRSTQQQGSILRVHR